MTTRATPRVLMLAGLGLIAGTSPVMLDSGAPLRAQATAPKQVPGEGVLCLWAFVSVASEIGRRCPGKRDEKFQSEVDESVKLIDDYVIANGGSPDLVSKFEREQGGAGVKDAQLCSGEGLGIYDHLRAQGGEALLKATRALVSKPGKPTWGDCV